jgi:hypothetical protein
MPWGDLLFLETQMEDMPVTLTHFTSMEGFLGILRSGFAFLPCSRELLDDLFGTRRSFVGDPQNYGMVCFTDASIEKASAVRKKGNYCIAMHERWAAEKGARKVEYIGPFRTFCFRQSVRAALKEIQRTIKSPDDEGLKLAFRNKQFAELLGATQYAQVLDRYEFCQTWRDRKQREWRISQKLPFYDRPERALPSTDGWSGLLQYLSFGTKDVVFLGCPEDEERRLRPLLPKEFSDVPFRKIL